MTPVASARPRAGARGRTDATTSFRPDIEGLRGVAVLLVVFGHLTGWPRGGFVGVDVFFVISGYLITGLLVGERERTGRIDVRHFYLRRARRLLPAGVLVLAATDVVASVLLLPSRAHQTVVDALWSLGFLANVHFASLGTDYFTLTRSPSPVQHYWSLSVEEQFYVVWPCLVIGAFALSKRRGLAGRRLVVAVAATVIVLSLAWSVLSTSRTPTAAYFSSPARAWELGAGALLVLLAPELPRALSFAGAAGLVASVLVITPRTHVPGYALALPVLSTVALLGAGGSRVGLGLAPIRYVGKISYSLYLWHWPCIVLGATLRGGTSPLGKAGLLLLAGGLSVASHHVVEQPFQRPREARVHRARGPLQLAAPLYVATLVFALIATWVMTVPRQTHKPVLVAARSHDLPTEIAAALTRSSWPPALDTRLVGAPEWVQDKCLDVSDKNAARCTYGPATATRSVALVGDSVAVSWLPALRRAPSLASSRIHVLTLRQCANLLGMVSPGCAAHQHWALAQLRWLRPDLVVMSARYQGNQTAQQWQQGTAQMLDAVRPYTHRIILLAPPPDTGNLQTCYTRVSSPLDCAETVSQRWRAYAGAELAAVTGRGTFVDPRPWFCVEDRCPAVVGDLPVMFDGRHLSAAYAASLGALLGAALS